MGPLHSLQRAKKLIVFWDPHLPEAVCQLVWEPAEMKILHSQRIVHTIQDGYWRRAQGLCQRVRRSEQLPLQACDNFRVEMINRRSSGPRIIV
jgi:hypothetical protein